MEIYDVFNELSGDLGSVDVDYLTKKVEQGITKNINRDDLYTFMAETAAYAVTQHPNYGLLGGRVAIKNLHENTDPIFLHVIRELHEAGIISSETLSIAEKHSGKIQSTINYDLDYNYEFFGWKTLERSYLLKINETVVERPQHMLMRVSIGIHGDNIEKIVETYHYMSQGFFTHATPTLFNSGTVKPQMSSCFLVAMKDDSIEGIYDTLKECAMISKMAGGIGMHVHNIRCSGSPIMGTNGTSNGLVPMLRVFNNTARYVDQCLHPETIIYTTEGPKQIQHCTNKTVVFTSNGPEKIQNVLEYDHKGEILRIAVRSLTMKITPEHPVLVFRGNPYKNKKECDIEEDPEFEWVEAKDLKPGDYLVEKKPRFVEDDPSITSEDCFIYKLLLQSYEGKFEVKNVPGVKEYLNSRCVKFTEDDMIRWDRNLVLPFRHSDFFDESGKKRIASRWLNLPDEKIKYIIGGRKNSLDDYLHLRLLPFEYEFSKIIFITKENYEGVVYDLQMEKTHDYMTECGLVHNGGGKRKGAFAVYLEPWHADIEDFLNLKKSSGAEESRARDLFYALWVPDLFMKRVESKGQWTLFDPSVAVGLADCHSEEFEELYERYESEGLGHKTMKAEDLYLQIIESQIETGTPYMLYKDSANRKSNQQNLGTIKCSNLCSEIIEYSAPDETAVCNLASIALPKFIDDGKFRFDALFQVAKVLTYNLNSVIDRNYYPTECCRKSNMRHRPIGIGIQGLADTFVLLGLPFTSPEARQLNSDIFETIYFGACTASIELAERDGFYETFDGSPISEGIFQFDMWEQTGLKYDWSNLRERVVKSGIRNSLLVAPMPTASTSQILGNNECFEPFTSNIYLRRVLAGEFPIVNKYLVEDLEKLNLWNDSIRNKIIAKNGSIQDIEEIPQNLKDLYKIVWEMKMKDLIDMAADRGRFIDQSQSLNLFIANPNIGQVGSMHMYSWKKGLKTGMYYLRTKPATDAIKITVNECTSCGS